jgi:hypothetical protein
VLTEMRRHVPTGTLAGLRDRALLALGFAGAFRGSELVALGVADITEVPDGLRVRLRRSKTDQEGEGQEIAIPRRYRLRPVQALQTWVAAASINTGPIFRPVGKGDRVSAAPLSAFSAAKIVKHYATRAGLEPASFAGHSLRCGRAVRRVKPHRVNQDRPTRPSVPGADSCRGNARPAVTLPIHCEVRKFQRTALASIAPPPKFPCFATVMADPRAPFQ